MKLYITKEQLDELSNDAYWKLRKWMDKKEWEFIVNGRRLSIGQMVEFLYERSGVGLEWPSLLRFIGDKESIAYKGTPMICDDLWGAVKEVLEKPAGVV